MYILSWFPTLTFLFLLSAPALHAQVFQGLGDLPDGDFQSIPTGISADGSVVVGFSLRSEAYEAFRWTSTVGMVGLGDLPGGLGSRAFAVSADGLVVVGVAKNAEGDSEAFRWDGEMEGLGFLPGEDATSSNANGVSADGAVVVGGGISDDEDEAFRWVGGNLIPLGGFAESASGVSSDGLIIVGSGNGTNGNEGFRWEGGALQGLGDLPGGSFSSRANAISADGSVVVGYSSSELGNEAFRWTEADGMQGLGILPGGADSRASAVSGDGSVIVGSSQGGGAMIWTEEEGMRSLQTVLEEDYGADLTGWTLAEATAVSADGSVIAGRGVSPNGPEAWRADLGSAVWLDPVSGFFNEPTRWSIDAIPAEPHAVRFDASTAAAYTVTFVQDQTTRTLTVDSTQVAFDLGGATYTLAETEADALRIGLAENHPAVLNLYGTGTLAAEDAVVGEEPGSSGFLGVGLDTPATLALDGVLTVGAQGTGELDVSDGGGTVTVRRGLLVGEREGSTGTVFVADGLLQVTEGTLLSAVGLAGFGTLDVVGGTLSLAGPVNIGSAPSGNGTLALTTGAAGTTHGELQVGVAGVGGLEVTSGAALTSADVTLGLQPSSFGTALIEGAGSRWEVSGTMRVGVEGAALVQLQDGATFCTNTFAYHIGPQGTVQAVGSVVVSEITTCPDAGADAVPSRGIAQTKRSGGALLVTPALFLAEGAVLEAEALLLEAGGTLGGEGTLALPITNTGTLAPGDSAGATGTFTVDGDYEQTEAGRLVVELQGGTPDTEHDVLSVAGTGTLGGTLQLLLLDGFEPEAGDAFTILTAEAVSGSFDAVEAPEGYAFTAAYKDDHVVLTLHAVANEDEAGALPEAFVLYAPYPNPTTGTTRLAFDVPEPAYVRLAIYDVLGREVTVLVDEERTAGRYEALLDGSGLASGPYLIRLATEGVVQTQRLTLLR